MLAGLRTARKCVSAASGLGFTTTVRALSQAAAAQAESIPILKTTKPSPKLGNLQQECWETYLSTGRGCLTVFSLIDTDHSNTISYSEIKYWMENGKL